MTMMPLGRRLPTDFTHIDKYPMYAAAATTWPVPVPIGINWYTNFDTPTMVGGRPWIGLHSKTLGTIRGGHCVCLLPAGLTDPASWWHFYDQGQEGACVGFGETRMMSLLNRKRYDARWLYQQAQLIDEYADTPPADGTSVRAGCDVLRKVGHVPIVRGMSGVPSLKEGITVNRWAKSVDDILAALGTPGWDHVRILNSWGANGYPHITNMPCDTLERLRSEDGEMAIVTDR